MSKFKNCLFGGCSAVDVCGRACEGCGFDRSEDRRRRMILHQRGLTRSRRTGKYRLVLRRKKRI